ncbi:MAG: ribulose-phosphate 3-epimerase [Duncaniella sp.]|nr:ribulose-phosphate 3-epimerase [Duncaniella sp.]MDE5733897.1 ribulose-phosphate 3-epimerase [Duncaniella sp.]MDE6179352.1 ribulose-phosphate 3-epimerase [Duncaniella sp.]MDE6390465.1 ribulose-phosphate 3-epimerase [Duncaniella sp.]
MTPVKIAPSILAADFARLAEAVDMVNRSEAAMLHIDVMDGLFVPNITIGFPVIASLAKISAKPMDVHMMVTDPGRFVSQVRDAGADIMNVHVEACTHLHRVVQSIRTAGMRAAVTLNPATPVCMLEEIISDVDMVLVMSVNPGFGGQKFITSTIDKIKRLKALMDQSGASPLIEVDGGVNLTTAPDLVRAGADVLVAGSYVFNAPDPLQAIVNLANTKAS